jgi:hypothetical protein
VSPNPRTLTATLIVMAVAGSPAVATGRSLPLSVRYRGSHGDQPARQLPKLPAGEETPSFKPRVFSVSTDHSDYFGGSTGRRLEPRTLTATQTTIGKLDWTQWTARSATAVGQDWVIYGNSCAACSRIWQDASKITLHAFDPVNGIFRKLKIISGPGTLRTPGSKTDHYRAMTETLTARDANGVFYFVY